jgi:pSer/pThr/pTyr-binding forkhead associated (FHA) protein
MEVKLKVISGSSAGQMIPVPGPKFLIGRADDCQLRPRSDLISRYHCVIMAEDGLVTVRDFGSKNFTYINGERLIGETELKPGDQLKVGPLEFELCITATVGAGKRPKVESVQEAAERTAQGAGSGSFDVDDFLDEAGDSTEARKDTQSIAVQQTEQVVPPGTDAPPDAASPMHGKVPPPKRNTVDSRAAADKALKQFFKRR